MLPLLSAILVGTSHQHAVQRVVQSPTLQQPPPAWVTESRDTPQANEASHDPRANDEASHDPRANGAAGPNSAAPPLALSEAGEDDIGEGGQAQNVHEKATCAVGLQTFACDRPILLLLHGQGHGGVAAPPCQRRARACAWWASSTTCLRKGMSSSSMMRSWFTKGMIAEIKACNEANTTMEMAALEEEMSSSSYKKNNCHRPLTLIPFASGHETVAPSPRAQWHSFSDA